MSGTNRQPTAWAEGVDETLTLHRLGVYGVLGRSLKTTNCLESVNALVEERCAKVDLWQSSSQRHRWLATALLDIEPRLRRVRGYRHLPHASCRIEARTEDRHDDVEEAGRVSNQEPWRVSTKNGLDSSCAERLCLLPDDDGAPRRGGLLRWSTPSKSLRCQPNFAQVTVGSCTAPDVLTRRSKCMNLPYRSTRRVVFCLGRLADVYIQVGRHEDAQAILDRLEQLYGPRPGSRGRLYAATGQTAEALAEVERLGGQGTGAAMIYAQTGLHDEALTILEAAVDARLRGESAGFAPFTLRDPGLDPVREDLRFDALFRRMGLPIVPIPAAP